MSAGRDRRQARNFAYFGATVVLVLGLGASGFIALLAPWAGLLGCLFSLVAAAAVLHRPGGVPILVYHSVSPDAGWLPWADNTSVRPEIFRRHLEVLKRDDWTVVTTMEFVTARIAGSRMSNRTVVLHFDDCYLDNFLFAAPILREFRMPATFFVSLDFIEPGEVLRTDGASMGPGAWAGYMSAVELRAMDADPLFQIEAHGVDHARVPVSSRTIGQLTESNWRFHAPLSWAIVTGNKARWYETKAPPDCLAPRRAIPENDSALSGRWWRNGTSETESTYAERVGAALLRARRELGHILGRQPQVFAWPFDRSCPIGVAAAKAAGFSTMTGGLGENRADEDPAILSRVHIQDRAFGGGPLWLEDLAFRARVNAASGRLGWHLLVALAARLRRLRFGRSGYGAVS